ncbi:Proteasome subunit beta [Aphelenchoides besseyi]|nr:Proteasome subunit beta [Aphelenchoides besseyi]KAI6209888.1 Proteasome subunit beta [Aphelenchoides besseyi]
MQEEVMGGNVLANMNRFRDAMRKASANPSWQKPRVAHQQRWNPYSFEGGSVCAIAGDNFVVSATDTRLTALGFSVMTREGDKIHVLNDNIVLATSGFHGDVHQLKRVLEARLHKYRFDYRCDMTVDLCSELLARNLYYKRFFPYYTGVVLCGIDEHGKGAVYGYDPVGTIERNPYEASGSGTTLMMPFLDNQLRQEHIKADDRQPLTIERAIGLVKDAFCFVAERETSTGDAIEIVVAEHQKPTRKFVVKLRED